MRSRRPPLRTTTRSRGWRASQFMELKEAVKKQDNVVTREEFEAYKKERMEESRERKAR